MELLMVVLDVIAGKKVRYAILMRCLYQAWLMLNTSPYLCNLLDNSLARRGVNRLEGRL
jgi:hypothetical protein